MATRKSTGTKIKAASTQRASVSFPSDLYKRLEAIAGQKKVSVAWVVRDAAEKYVATQWPLLNAGAGVQKRDY